jgi:hypothetical protein
MRGLRVMGMALVMIVAGSGLLASEAVGKTLPLILREAEGGPVLATGATLNVVFSEASPSEHFCTYIAAGELLRNSQSKDPIATKMKLNCEEIYNEKYFWRGTITRIALNSGGQLAVTANPALRATTENGRCRYATSKLVGTFPIPGELSSVEASGVGKRTIVSPPSCPPTESIVAFVGVEKGNHAIYAET